MSDIFKFVGLVAILIFVVVIGPLATLWSVNTLFPAVAIPYTIETWFAVVILGAFFKSKVSIKK